MNNIDHEIWFNEAAQMAKQSLCKLAQCGAVIVANNQIIGAGFNSPAGGEPYRCLDKYTIPKDNKHNITCCTHAEIRAIHDATKKFPKEIGESTLYFIRVDQDGQLQKAGTPYCTTCSSEALDSGVKFFALWHTDQLGGIKIYPTQEYQNISYNYFKDSNLWQLK